MAFRSTKMKMIASILLRGFTSARGLVASNYSSCVGTKAVSAECSSREIPIARDYFYVGGQYVYESAYSSSIYSDQIYVEKLSPPQGASQSSPLLFVNAGVPSGAVSPR